MKMCSITPLKNVDLMYKHDIVMLLAHLSKIDENYAAYARNNACYKIMDNSIIELGDAFSMEDLINEAIKCDVDEIILPDVFNDGLGTVEKVKESIEWLKDHNLIGRFKLMAVCHGTGLKEFKETFNILNSIPEIDVIGIPKVLCKWIIYRYYLAGIFLNTQKEIHLLGVWDSMREIVEIPFSMWKKIRSFDTCLISLLSIKNKSLLSSREGETIDLENDEVNVPLYETLMERYKFFENAK